MEEILSLVNRHIDLMKAAIKESNNLYKAATNNDMESIEASTSNRERILNLLARVQLQAEEKINVSASEQMTSDKIAILKAWLSDTNQFVEEMDTWDNKISQQLELLKNQTQEEISQIHGIKEKFKGYNLNSVRK
jgi:vacuolar-type H+-ATPase subunit I/STV1